MPTITWDQVGTRRFESGVDRGVLYPPSGEGVPWSGLTSVVEKMRADVEGVYFDGRRIGNAITYGEYSADLSCITYPIEFEFLQGSAELRRGIQVGDQPLQTFGLCYRTLIGDDVNGDEAAYKLHMVYNLVAVPSDKTYTSKGDDPSLVEYSYALTAIPEDVPGYRPTAQIVVQSDKVYPWLMEELEARLYGSGYQPARMIPLGEMVKFLREWARIKITYNEAAGTWSATTDWPGIISFPTVDSFRLDGANASFKDTSDSEYIITDLVEDPNLVAFEVLDDGKGFWTLKTDHEGTIVDKGDGKVEIQDADPIFTGPSTFRIKSKKILT